MTDTSAAAGPSAPAGAPADAGRATADGGEPTASYEVVLVTYHSRKQVTGLLAALGPTVPVVVVDNASGADGIPEVVADRPRTRGLDGQNVGFARAANLGARSSTADYLVFVNPDTRPTVDILRALVADLAADPTLASVAAATTDEHGRIELGVGGWEPTPRRCLVYASGLHRRWPRAGVVARPEVGEQIELGWITGACLAVRRETFLQLGGFDERYFVYNEDMAFGRAVLEAGLRQRLRTDLLVRHETSGSGPQESTDRHAPLPKMPQQKGASMASYLVNHNGPVRSTVMRATLMAGFLPRLGVALLRGDRTARRHHLAYLKGQATRRSPYRR